MGLKEETYIHESKDIVVLRLINKKIYLAKQFNIQNKESKFE